MIGLAVKFLHLPEGEIYYVTMLSYSNEGHCLPIQICWMPLSVPLSHKVIILRHKCKEYLIAGKDYLQVTTIPVAQQWHSLYTRHMYWLQYTGNFWSMFWPPTPMVCVCRTIVFILTMIIVCARFIGLCSDIPVLQQTVNTTSPSSKLLSFLSSLYNRPLLCHKDMERSFTVMV